MRYNAYFNVGELKCCGDYVVADSSDQVLMAACFDRSKIKVQGCLMNIVSNKKIAFMGKHFSRNTESKYKYSVKSVYLSRDRMAYGIIINQDIGEKYLITTANAEEEDIYALLMNNYTAPIMKKWVPALVDRMVKDGHLKRVQYNIFSVDDERMTKLHGKKIPVKELAVWEIKLTQEELEETLSDMLKSRIIYISQTPVQELEFTDMDSYLMKYGKVLADKIESQIDSHMDLKGSVDGLALKNKRLFPQQAACVNGIKALKENGRSYGLMIEGMGVGKTIQGASIVESYFAEEWLSEHKDMTLKDMYLDENSLNYRAIVNAPGHLVKKWKEEIETEVPYAKATIISDLSDLIALRKHVKDRHGREVFIIGKDKAKLGSMESPIPSKVSKMRPMGEICMDCLTASVDVEEYPTLKKMQPFEKKDIPFNGNVRFKGMDGRCPSCKGRHFHSVYLSETAVRGMICPHCSKLLMRNSSKITLQIEKDILFPLVLQPSSFSTKTSDTKYCYHCGNKLWGYDCKPVGKEPRKSPWKLAKFFTTARKDKTSRVFVLKGYEREVEKIYKFGTPEIKDHEFGIRRYPLERYAKKYLKGCFDFCILDEVHKFEGFSSAQANAAHSFMKCSAFTMGLTGTIANGSAASLFSLLFRLDPSKMREKGYSFDEASLMRFCRHYGVVESSFEDDDSGSYNLSSRGKIIQQPRVKPGISPVLFIDFLLGNAVFLDLSDLSKYLPPLHEYVVTVKMPEDIALSYGKTNQILKNAMYTKEGKGCMTDILQFGLSYPDKPYARNPIMSCALEDYMVASVDNYPSYIDNLLPKEEKLIDIINKEIAEGRNCFVYCSFTGKAEMNITGRLQSIIEKHCNLKGRVEVLHSNKPKADAREEYIHQRAEAGIKVFICNPKIVETGLDFCFKYNGKFYNYPTLIFFQTSYELAVIWQASRRAYRLNQPEECRTYWMAYEGTLQLAALDIMAQKQVATSAIQGKFSAEGLASLAKGVDARVKLAQALANGDTSDRKSIENMFDVLAKNNATDSEDDDPYGDYVPPKTFYELTGFSSDYFNVARGNDSSDSEYDDFLALFGNENSSEIVADVTMKEIENTSDKEESFEDVFGDFFSVFGDTDDNGAEVENYMEIKEPKKKKRSNRKSVVPEGQVSLLDLLVG